MLRWVNLWPPWTAARQASLSIPNSWSLLKFMSIKSVMPSNHLILCCPLTCLNHLCSALLVLSPQRGSCLQPECYKPMISDHTAASFLFTFTHLNPGIGFSVPSFSAFTLFLADVLYFFLGLSSLCWLIQVLCLVSSDEPSLPGHPCLGARHVHEDTLDPPLNPSTRHTSWATSANATEGRRINPSEFHLTSWSDAQNLRCCIVAKSCPTLCDPMDCKLPGSSVHGILRARILEWVAIPSPGDLPHPGIKLGSPALQADSLPTEPPGRTDMYRNVCLEFRAFFFYEVSWYGDCQIFFSLCFLPLFIFLFGLECSPFDPIYNLVKMKMKRLGNWGLKVVAFGVTFPPSEWSGTPEHVPFTSCRNVSPLRTESFQSLTLLRQCYYLVCFHWGETGFSRNFFNCF